MMTDRPKRRAIPARIKKAVRERQKGACGCMGNCGYVLPPDGLGLVHYQHTPALELREVLEDGSDWNPPQHDPRYIFAEQVACHRRETDGPRGKHTSIDSDKHAIAKVRRLRNPKPSKHPMKSTGRKMAKRADPWNKKYRESRRLADALGSKLITE